MTKQKYTQCVEELVGSIGSTTKRVQQQIYFLAKPKLIIWK